MKALWSRHCQEISSGVGKIVVAVKEVVKRLPFTHNGPEPGEDEQ